MPVIKFTEEIKAYVLANYQTMCGAEIAEYFGVKTAVINTNMRRLNIRTPQTVTNDYRSSKLKKDYTHLHDFIIQNIDKVSMKQMAKDLRLSSVTIARLVRELGCEDIIEKRKLESRIQPGDVPPNKGKKWDDFLTKEKQEKIKRATHFQKGHKPMNTKQLGSVQMGKDGYLRLKVRDAETNGKNKNYESLNRVIYEFFHGDLQDNEVVIFVDGNIYNFHPDNLVKKSKYENLINNIFSEKKLCEKYQLKPSKEVKKISQIIINSKILNHEVITKSNV